MATSPFLEFDLATVINIITAVAIVIGVAFGIIELRHADRNRRDYAAFDIIWTVQTQEVRLAMQHVFSLPENADPENLQAALTVDSACEMWGSMVLEGVVDLHMLDRMIGGWVRETWVRLGRWVEAERVETGNQNIGEWWQWLYERLEEDPEPGKKLGAHIAYRGKNNAE